MNHYYSAANSYYLTKHMNIILLGFMGSGKSTIGKQLAKELDYSFKESDAIALERSGLESISEVFNLRRTLWTESEIEAMRHISHYDDQVIACGGDIAENEICFQYFQENGKTNHIVYLNTSSEILAERIVTSHKEKGISDFIRVKANIDKIFEKRDSLYKFQSTITVNTDNKKPLEITKEILKSI